MFATWISMIATTCYMRLQQYGVCLQTTHIFNEKNILATGS
jgi:hypothetical protein